MPNKHGDCTDYNGAGGTICSTVMSAPTLAAVHMDVAVENVYSEELSPRDLEAQPMDVLTKEVDNVRLRVDKLEEQSGSEADEPELKPAKIVVVPLKTKPPTSAGAFM
jgi:PBP1b-binding outer membrane lipoprotein LpoB